MTHRPLQTSRWSRLVLATVALLAFAAARPASAQTAHYSGVISSLPGTYGNPYSVAVDSKGDVFVASTTYDEIQEVPAGCTTSACIAIYNLPAQPDGVAVDASGNIYLTLNTAVVEEIPASCTPTNFNSSACSAIALGGAYTQPTGIAVDTQGNVYVSDETTNQITKVPAGCTATAYAAHSCSVTALGSGFNKPTGITLDSSGNIYVANYGSSLVQEMPASCSSTTCTVTTLPGTYNQPVGVSLDDLGNIYIADLANNSVDEIPAGCAASACVIIQSSGYSTPYDVAAYNHQFLYVTSSSTSVTKIALGSVAFPSTPVGTKSAAQTLTFTFDSSGSIGTPVVLTNGTTGLDFADAGTGTCDTNGATHTYAAGASCTVDVTFTPKYPGVRTGAVELVNSSNAVIATADLYGTGTGPQVAFAPPTTTSLAGSLTSPEGVAVDSSGNVYFAAGTAVQEIPSGCTTSSCIKVLGGGFTTPSGVAVDGAGNVFVTDGSAVKKIPAGCTTSTCVSTIASGFSTASNLAIDGAGNIFVADSGNSSVSEIPAGCTTSTCVTTLGGGFSAPQGLTVDGSGNVFVSDTGNNVVKEIPAGCTTSTCVTTVASGFSQPQGITIDSAGDLYVSDTGNNAVKEIPSGCTTSTCITTVASGLTGPSGLALNSTGDLFVANNTGGTIQKLARATPPTLTFPTIVVDTTSGPQVATLQNIGNATLTFPVPTVAGTYNPNLSQYFTYDNSSSCNQTGSGAGTAFTLASAATCTVAIDFAPTIIGSITGNAVLTDDSLNAASPTYTTQTIPLNGTSKVPVTQLAYAPAPPATLTAGGNAGTVKVNEENSSGAIVTNATDTITLAVTGPNSYSQTYTATAVAGIATFDLSTTQLTAAGKYTYQATSSTYTPATATEVVSASSATSLVAVSGSGQSAIIGQAFTNPLVVEVEDAFGNPISGATVTFTVPASGASATLTTPALTTSNGQTSVTATANGLAGSYSVTAASAGATTPASFSLINQEQPTTLTVTPSPTTLVYGQPVAINAVISPASVLTTVPTGTITFYDGPTALAPAEPVASAMASYDAAVPSVGTHTYGAQYSGDANFKASTLTAATAPVVVNKAASTLIGPDLTSVNYGSAGTIAVNVVGQYSGAAIAKPSGSIVYSITGTAITGTATISNGVATIPVPATLAIGTYPVNITYGGDANYNAATPITVTLTIIKATATVTLSNLSQTYTGAPITAVATTNPAGLNVTITYNGSTIPPISPGNYTVVATIVDTNYSGSATGTLVIARANTAVSLTSSAANSNLNSSVTFTAMVTSAASGTPTGSVEFLDGSTVLGSAPLNTTGTAAYSTTSLSAGLHQITAVYSGDTNFNGSTSASLAEIVTAPDFMLTSSVNNITLKPGQTGQVTINFIPVGGFQGTVNFTCTGMPDQSICQLAPTSLVADGSNTQQTTTLTLKTYGPNTGTVAMLTHPGNPSGIALAGIFWLPGLLFGLFLFWQRRKISARYQTLFLLVLIATTLSGMVGCGYGTLLTGPGVSTVTITATSGSTSHAITVAMQITK